MKIFGVVASGRAVLMLTDYYLRHGKRKIRETLGKVFEAIELCAEEGECGSLDFWVSGGSSTHWKNSLRYALENGGFMIWGQRVKRIKELKSIEALIGGRSFIDSYLQNLFSKNSNNTFLINIYYVNSKGIIGAGLVTMLIFDIYNVFWDEEVSRGKVEFPFRWLSKVFWLHETVRNNINDTDKWYGEELAFKMRVTGLQRIRNSEYKKEIAEILKKHKQEFENTINFFEKHAEILTIKIEKQEKVTPSTELKQDKCAINVGSNGIKKIKNEILSELVIDEWIVDWAIRILVYGCRNLLLVGKPGIGKTTLARLLAEKLGFKPVIVTAHAHWSRHDVIGGLVIRNSNAVWRPGAFFKALIEYHRAVKEGFRGAWLIIDEVNRADVDKAFGEFFTIFSGINASEWIIPFYIVDEIRSYPSDPDTSELLEVINSLEKTVAGYRLPSWFRVIATLNYVDVTNLFTLGEAFTRRFAKIVIEYPLNVEEEYRKLRDKLQFLLAWNSTEEKEAVLNRLDEFVEKTGLLSIVSELRGVEEISFGPAHFSLVLQDIVLTIKENPSLSLKDIVENARKAIRMTISLSELWDEEVREKVDNILSKLKIS